MSFRNFTPHPINVIIGDETREFKSEGVARVSETQEVVRTHDGVELRRTKYGAIEGLPEPDGKSLVIVSLLVKQVNLSCLYPRTDLVSPDSGKTSVRDEKGNIKGVTGFCL